MKKNTLIIAFALLLNLTYAQQKDNAQLTTRFDKMLSEQFKPGETGATVIVARKGEILYKKAFGMANMELDVPMQVDNVFRIASITKQFTAIAILQLMEQGKLSLQDEIIKFIPDYATHGNKITIEHLLTHTSGIQEYTSIRDSVNRGTLDYTPLEMINRFRNLPLRFTPGTKWEYSNSGYFLLGYVIEKITGRPYANYLEENFFKPLGMTGSHYASDTKLIKKRANGYTANKTDYENAPYISMTQPYAAGSILSTAEDLFKWKQAVISYKLVKKETVDKAFTKYKLTDGKETAYGYGWRVGNVYESPSTWHGGLINGFFSMALYLPKEDVYVAVLTNCDCSPPEVVAYKLAALAAGRRFEHKEIVVTNNKLQGYTGVYENEKGQQRIITTSDNKLFSQLGRGPKSLVRSYETDKFYYDADPMATIDFTRNKTGNVEKLSTATLRGIDVWNKTNKPLPGEDGIKLADQVLEVFVGVYQISADINFSITKEQSRLFLQATGQEKLEIFAETPSIFFLKVNDAQLEFVRDAAGRITKAILKQGGRVTEARKIK